MADHGVNLALGPSSSLCSNVMAGHIGEMLSVACDYDNVCRQLILVSCVTLALRCNPTHISQSRNLENAKVSASAVFICSNIQEFGSTLLTYHVPVFEVI